MVRIDFKNLMPVIRLILPTFGFTVIAAMAGDTPAAGGKTDMGELFAQAFGERFRLDPEKVREAIAKPAGASVSVDENGDGAPDAFYFVDRDSRHEKQYQPIVVKAVAPEGNFKDGRLVWTNVFFVADWNGDGKTDRLVAHLDDDGDGDIDRQLLSSPWLDYFGPLHLVLSEDIGDDNRLWYHRNYWTDVATYWWRSDFNGDEVFHFFTYDADRREWVQKGEGPFAFYDDDHDGFSDEVIRRDTTFGDGSASVRWSFDLDRDANRFQPHDYDFSFSAYGPMEIPDDLSCRSRIGLASTGPYLPWKNARKWVRDAHWRAVMFTFDEADNNIDLQSPNRFGQGEFHEGSLNERWEGVLNHGDASFPQIGGPSAGSFNRRVETDRDNSGKMALYFSPADRLIHLFGAETGIQKIDFDFDGRIDMEIRTGDRNGDGWFDSWEVDVDVDGVADLTYGYLDRMLRENAVPHSEVPADPGELSAFFIRERQKAIDDDLALIDVMRAVLMVKEKNFRTDEAEIFYREKLRDWQKEYRHGEKMRASADNERFYANIICHRYFHRVMKLDFPHTPTRSELMRHYWNGDHQKAAMELKQLFPQADAKAYTPKGVVVTLTNTSNTKLWRHPAVIKLRKIFPNRAVPVDGVSVFDGVEHLAPSALVSQCDDLDGDGVADELVFSVDLRPKESKAFRVEIAKAPAFPSGVHVFNQESSIRWETGFEIFDWNKRDGLRFAGKQAHVIYGHDGLASSVGDQPKNAVLRLSCSDAKESVTNPQLKVVREGPLRAVLRGAKCPLLVLPYANLSVTEIRWNGDGILGVFPAVTNPPPAKENLMEISGSKVWQRWDGDDGIAIFLPDSASCDSSGALNVDDRKGGSCLWVHGWWGFGQQSPIWNARSNWFQSLEQVALKFRDPLSVKISDAVVPGRANSLD